jgi:hypothetical protein
MPETAAITEIPDTIEALQTLVHNHAETIRQLQNQLIWTEEKYKALALRYFGRKSEKGKEENSKQYRLFNEVEVYAREGGLAVLREPVRGARQRRDIQFDRDGEGEWA